MPPEIRELDAETRDRIAAGEVVERPASVVKELVENALDADASRVDVTVEAGGTDRIVVSDDGVGMAESDARLAIEEHTTSKLRDVGELAAIGTLGFRGEALHAIGSIARLGIRTKPRGGSHGTELIVGHGELVSCGPTGCPEGTTVEVRDLFGNVPARRKYLKTEATEFDHVARIVTGYALARPDVAISLSRDGGETFATTGDGDRKSAVMAVYGRDVASSMIPVESEGDDGPLAGVEGLVSHPETNRAGREYVTTLVEGRYVTASTVREAVVDAYGDRLAPDRYPFAVVDLSLPPGGVDVNVHPRKLEVLFAEEAAVKAGVAEAVESALSEAGLLRSRAPRGRSAPEQTAVSPGTPRDGDRGGSDGHGDRDDAAGTEGVETGSRSEKTDVETGEASTSGTDRTGGRARNHGTPGTGTGTDTGGEVPTSKAGASTRKESSTTASPSVDSPSGATTQRTLDGGETAGTPERFDRLPDLGVLGQFDDTYLVAEADDGLVLIDQHAADERVNYERLRERFAGDVTTQTLADPVTVGVTAREAALVSEYGEALSRLGFRTRLDDDETLAVTTVPAFLADHVGETAPKLARDLLGEFVGGDPDGTVESVVDDVLGDLACHPSIKGNTSLREGTVKGLLEALDGCENPYACPHGRPTVIEVSTSEIDERFERDYPGHGGRRR
ncbi:DNA mismatch repair endonuclease MutL [Natronomonas sp. LN261]|uniref:DNA mismatch repair endonuclease MutL n=1 Tax=Natronomonas sp. LN261 TaxID=2750669 RepID=UPI0015EED2C2|nr:DNA mismatch repair endonuclease MutL [Natronomonas sp. LN261]